MTLLPDTTEISAADLARLMEAAAPVQIMDLRAPERVAQSRIDTLPPERFHNIRGSELMQHTSLATTGLDPRLPTVLICGQGKDSQILAFHLGRLGLDSLSLKGGMVAWMNLALPRELDPPQGVDRLVQLDRIGKGCLGYLVVSSGEALIVDPPLQVQPYLDLLEETAATLVGVADTHVHADYVSGAPGLAHDLGVPYYLHPADSVYPYDGTPGKVDFRALSDGDRLEVGKAVLRVVHTPGHTEGSVSYLLQERAALTGDFLFVESIGRPDLGGREETWAVRLWESVERAKGEWGPGMAIYPAHYASPRERRMGNAVGIDFETLLRENPTLGMADKDEFVSFILDSKAPFPEGYRKIKALNLGLAPLVPEEVEELEMGRNECALGGIKP